MKLKGLKEMKNENNKRDFITIGDLCIIDNKPYIYSGATHIDQKNTFYNFSEIKLLDNNTIMICGEGTYLNDKEINNPLNYTNTLLNMCILTKKNYGKIEKILRRLLQYGKSK